MHSTDEAARIPGAQPTVETNVAPVVPAPTGMPVPLVVATAASATAGLIHGVAAGSHSADRTLAWMFAICAVAQLAWAGVAALRPSRAVLLAGALLNGGALVVWGLTRTVGIGFVESLAGTEAVTTPDLTAALLAGTSVLGVVGVLGAHNRLPRISPIWAGVLAAVVLATGAPAMTAGQTHGGHGDDAAHAHADGEEHADAAAHAHAQDDEDHAHADGEEHADGADHAHAEGEEHADGAEHAHADGDVHADGAAHGHAEGEAHDPSDPSHAHGPSDPTHPHDPADPTHPHDPADPTHPHDPAVPHDPTDPTHPHDPTDPTDPTHPHDPTDPTDPAHPDDPTDPTHPHDPVDDGPYISVDDPRLTDAQRQAAISLIDVSRAGMTRFTDVASVRAAGYTSIGDASTGYEHFVHFGFLNDGYLLDPDRIESIVFQVNPDGSKVIVSAMYILSQGMTMEDAPDIAGPLTTWHDHQDLCWSLDGSGNPIVVGIRPPGGSCPPGSLFVATPPMLHVWIVDHPCGPFAGIETDGAQGPHGTSCLHDEH